MKLPSKERLVPVAVVLLLAIPLALLLSRAFGEFVREAVVIPFSYLFWILRLYFRSIPPLLFWGALLLFGLLIAVTSLASYIPGGQTEEAGEAMEELEYPGRVQRLTKHIHMAARSDYFRQRLAQRLSELVVEELTYSEKYTLEQVEQGLDALDTPPEVREFLERDIRTLSLSRSDGLIARLVHRLWGRAEPRGFNAELERVVQFLGDRLGVQR